MVMDDLLQRLRSVDACSVSDPLDSLEIDTVVRELSPLAAPRRICGRAFTVALGMDDGRESHRHLGIAAAEASGPGTIVVVDHQAREDVAGWGGILSLAASRRGMEGIVIDGAFRDIDEARELDLPVYGRCGTPRTARGRVIELAFGELISLCGVPVTHGDYMVADGSGIVVIPQCRAEAVIAAAERIMAKER